MLHLRAVLLLEVLEHAGRVAELPGLQVEVVRQGLGGRVERDVDVGYGRVRREDGRPAARPVVERERPDEREDLADQVGGVVLVQAAVRAGVGEVDVDGVAAQPAGGVDVLRANALTPCCAPANKPLTGPVRSATVPRVIELFVRPTSVPLVGQPRWWRARSSRQSIGRCSRGGLCAGWGLLLRCAGIARTAGRGAEGTDDENNGDRAGCAHAAPSHHLARRPATVIVDPAGAPVEGIPSFRWSQDRTRCARAPGPRPDC